MSALWKIFFIPLELPMSHKLHYLAGVCMHTSCCFLLKKKKMFFLLIESFRLEKTFQMFSLTVSHVYVLNLFFCFPDLWAL